MTAPDSMLARYARVACKCRPTYLCRFCRRMGVREDLVAPVAALRAAGLLATQADDK
jgi:hypothetical protein